MDFPNSFKTILIDGDMVAFSICAAVEYGKEPEDVNLNDILDSIDSKLRFLKRYLGAEEMRIFFTSSANFRYKINYGYKANRVDVWKPFHLANARLHMKEFWGAEESYGLEADDLMAIYQDTTNHSTCIVTLDKDLKQVPGCHYNWETKNSGEVKEIVTKEGYLNKVVKYSAGGVKRTTFKGAGALFFCYQLLIGDSTDGIIGCGRKEMRLIKSGKDAGKSKERRVGVGPAEAYSWIEGKTPTEAFQNVILCYKDVFGDDWEEQLLIQGRSLFMLRELPVDNIAKLWCFYPRHKANAEFDMKNGVFLHG